MLELVSPTTAFHAAFLQCRDDWGSGLHEDGFGLADKHDLDSPDGFAAWVNDRLRFGHPSAPRVRPSGTARLGGSGT